MKKAGLTLCEALALTVCVLAASCGNPWMAAIIGDKFDDKSGGGPGLSVIDLEDFGGPADEYKTFSSSDTAALQSYLNSNAASGRKIAVTTAGIHTLNPGTTLTNGTIISLRGSGELQLNSNGNLFKVNNGTKLILRGPTLVGLAINVAHAIIDAGNGGSLVIHAGAVTSNGYSGVNVDGGFLMMNGGSISSNNAGNTKGGGVYVNSSGNFTMNGGHITGNTTTAATNYNGGGVYAGGTFIMNGGDISGNTAWYGGGVHVEGTFTMKEGSISGNTSQNGGGVAVSTGNFTMNGGIIGGTAAVSGNTANAYGGGVYVYNTGSFTMNRGTIKGYVPGHTSGHDPADPGRDGCNVVWNGSNHMSTQGAAVWNDTSGTVGSPGFSIGSAAGVDGDIIVP